MEWDNAFAGIRLSWGRSGFVGFSLFISCHVKVKVVLLEEGCVVYVICATSPH